MKYLFPVVFGVMSKEPKEDDGFARRSRQLVVFIWGTQSFSTDLPKMKSSYEQGSVVLPSTNKEPFLVTT